RVAINAIHPWVIVSAANHVRADLGSFYRDWVKTSYLNPIPGPDDGVAETLLDRTAYTVSKLRELELDDHRAFGADPLSATVCDRMTLLYGRMWNHKNLSQETHKAFIHMMGTAPQGVYAHLYYYSLLNRLTDRHGDNVYLRRNNIETRWTFDTIFLHGNDSRVFNPYSAEKSAIRLREIVGIKHPGQYAFRSRVFDDYGHMDVIIGKHAYRDIFGDVLDFYDNQAGAQNEMDRPDEFPHRPRMGPFLRAAWLEDGRLRLRYWAELKVMLDRRQAEMDVAGSQVTRQAEACVTHVDSGNNRHRMIDVETCDAPPSRLSFELYGAMRAGLKVARSPQAGHGVVIEYADEAWYRRIVNVASGESSDQTTFLVGSCRFPGSVIDCDLTDRAYAAMHGHLDKAELLFLIGDQIYADATDQLFKVRSLRAKYRFRYQRAFDARYSPNFAALVRRIPTHFAIDDHEFADNWSGDPREPKDLTAAEKERVDDDRATMSYGLNNARRFQTSFRDQAPIGGGSAFYYALRHPDESSFPTFVMDTRSERQFRATSDPAKYRMIEKAQEDALLEWLCKAAQESPGAPKFIVSGSTLAPLPQRYVESPAIWRQLDGWAGYPETVEKVLYEIVANDIRNVVFVGGNEHFSAFARLCIKAAGREVTAWQVISSAFYAPMPFANSQANDYRWDVPVSWPVHLHQPMTVDYEARLLSTIGSQFMQVTASSRGLEMDLFNARDEKCRSASIDFASQMFSVRQ
ncbi:MAG TPA: alkaline phosphatase D family protein, partial [Pseudomonadales bacterium]|nr:alkaline phosphatase D family protein [Pseudomonadales bacterium]